MLDIAFKPYPPPKGVKGVFNLTSFQAVVLLASGTATLPRAPFLGEEDTAAMARVLKNHRFKAKKGTSLVLNEAAFLGGIPKLFLFGVGDALKPEKFAADAPLPPPHEAAPAADCVELGAKLQRLLVDSKNVALFTDDSHEAPALAALLEGMLANHYQFLNYKTVEPEKYTLQRVTVYSPAAGVVKALTAQHTGIRALTRGVHLTRDLVSHPPNELHPESFAARCLKLTEHGLEVQVLGQKELEKLGMRALLGVNQGSVRAPRLVVMRWWGDKKTRAVSAFVGKGVTFDTGGISLKPAAGMASMKYDMAGAGAVTGAMVSLAGRKVKANVVGVLGLVENMPDGGAQRPGDIVRSASGKTIEILNTDAEGRLVLADALWYVQKEYAPKTIIDLATLTGAMLVALGHQYAGLFGNDEALKQRLMAAGQKTGEGLWPLPMGSAYDKQLDSDIADVKNIGSRYAGSITAAQFLQRFIEKKTAWAHLDIAGVAWENGSNGLCWNKGATGWGVRLLDRYGRDL